MTILYAYMSEKNVCACCPCPSEESIVSPGTDHLKKINK